MPTRPGYADEQLTAAVAAAYSWRGVLRVLGLQATSAGASRSARRHADRLGLSYAHFTGQRTWTESELVQAVAVSRSWQKVLTKLGLAVAGGNLATVRGYAMRLTLAVDHLTRSAELSDAAAEFTAAPRRDMLRVAAPSMAAAWFQLRGYLVLWPQEGCRYDLVVSAEPVMHRIQVKTTTHRQQGKLGVRLASTRQDRSSPYDVDEIDHFVVIDDQLDAHLIPTASWPVCGSCR